MIRPFFKRGKRNPYVSIYSYRIEDEIVVADYPMTHCPEYCPFKIVNCVVHCLSISLLERECIQATRARRGRK